MHQPFSGVQASGEISVHVLVHAHFDISPGRPFAPSGRSRACTHALRARCPAARGGARTWAGRLVLQRHATHILIVSDAPERNPSIDRRLEAEIERLDAAFSVTEPLEVAGYAEGVESLVTYEGNGQ